MQAYSNPIDDSLKILELLERYNQGRNNQGSAGAPTVYQQPGLNQDTYSINQFQTPNQQQFAEQEYRRLNPTAPLTNPRNYQELGHSQAILGNEINNLASYTKKAATMIMDLLSVINGLYHHIGALEEMAALAGIYNSTNYDLNVELNAAYSLINIQAEMLNTPVYMLKQAFDLCFETVDPNDYNFTELLSEYYIGLISAIEEKRRQINGNYSESYSQYLQSEMQQQQQPGFSRQRGQDFFPAKAPKLAQTLQRRHASARRG